ncbi:sugar ABC transporter permease [Mesorhizobium sp. CU2]|nr:sugar ABC transporter permease [Mesorhizobium sp. CU2]
MGSAVPLLVLGPSLVASFVYVFVFTGWTLYISLSNSSLLPTYGFVGLDNYASLWANRRWNIAYDNLFLFSGFYIVGSMAVGLLLAILIDQRVRGEAAWRTIFLYPLAVSFIVTGTVWSWLYNPTDGIQAMVRGLGWTSFSFALASDRHYAIYAVIITGVWQASGFAMALFLAGLRSVDQDLVKAAQIDGASTFRIYRKVLLPTIAPIFLAVAVIQIQFAIKTFDLVAALTKGGPGISTTFPAIYVYDLMFQRGQIAEGAAAAIMMLAAVAVVLLPYSFWVVWRRRKEAGHG